MLEVFAGGKLALSERFYSDESPAALHVRGGHGVLEESEWTVWVLQIPNGSADGEGTL